jgi:hypothetical protein
VRNDLALLFATTILSYPIGLWLRQPWLLPILNALPAYAVLVNRLRRGERGGAVRAMLWWAVAVALTATVLFIWWPQPVAPVVYHGAAYKAEMFQWIRTGRGAEGSIRLFLPQHLLHLGAFVVLGLLTASVGAIVLGAALMNYMAYYVAALAKAGVPPWAVALLGWQPWAIARIAAFCTLGVLMAEPLLFRLFPGARVRMKRTGRGAYVVAAISGILADWFLKATLAATWGRWLHKLLP